MPTATAGARTPVDGGLPALVFGKHITALGALRVLSRRGVDVRCVEATRDMLTASRWYRPAEPTLPETTDSDLLARYLDGLSLPRAVLMPCSDKWVAAVAGLPPRLRERFPSSVPDPDLVDRVLDKGRFREQVESLGLPMPRTTLVSDPADLDRLTDEELASGFLKPTDSASHNRAFGVKGWFIDSRADATRKLAAGYAAGITYLLQEWIPGPPSHTVIVDGYVDRHAELKALIARRRVRMYPPRLANTCCGMTIRLDDVSPAVETARRLVAAMDWRGIFNLEFKLDPRDGEYKVIELNPRPFWIVAHVAAAGVDLPWLSYLDAQGLPVPAVTHYQVGRYGVYELTDAESILHAVLSRRRPDPPVLRSWLAGDHAAFWPTDPLPAIHDLGDAIAGKLASFRRRHEGPGR